MANIKKAFQVRALEGTHTRKVFDYELIKNAKGKEVRQRTETDVEVDNGWMVFFPNGSSIHVTTMAEMQRLGFADSNGRVYGAALVDMESGEVVGKSEDLDVDFEAKSNAVTSKSRAKKAFRDAELGVG